MTTHLFIFNAAHLVLFVRVDTPFGEPLLGSGNLVAATLPRGDLVDVHPVQLFQRTALAFDDEEVDDNDGDNEASGKDVAVGEVNRARDERSEETDEEVPGPVGRGG